jgi:hypothetical protein
MNFVLWYPSEDLDLALSRFLFGTVMFSSLLETSSFLSLILATGFYFQHLRNIEVWIISAILNVTLNVSNGYYSMEI